VLEVGALFGRYRIEAELGKGGMGCVYRAQDTRLNRRIALKVIKADPEISEADWTAAKARMLREAQAAAALDHPNAVSIFDVGEIDGLPFIAMELIEGVTLRSYVGDAGTTWQRKLGLLVAVAEALDAAHRAQLVHRDIKPENVMVKSDGRVKVLDFGIARRAAVVAVAADGPTQLEGALPTLTGKGQIVGTPLYMAPEQIVGKPLDGRADQFAWGVMAYELLVGAPPWKAPDTLALLASVLTVPAPPLRASAPELPEALESAVARALAKDPADRHESMAVLLASLASMATPYLTGPVPSALPSAQPALSHTPSPARTTGSLHVAPTRRWSPVAIVAIGALMAGGGLVMAQIRGRFLHAVVTASPSAAPTAGGRRR
jgi:serine/threonine-protein kinase